LATETTTKPKQLIRPMPVDWYLKKPAYTWFMIRDITSLPIMIYCLFLLCVMERSINGTPEQFAAFYARWTSLLSIILHVIALAFAVYHSVSFFNLTPQVIVQYRGDEKVPGSMIAGAHYGLWAVVSLIIIVIGLWV
jgi:fumarate reductase subunit C